MFFMQKNFLIINEDKCIKFYKISKREKKKIFFFSL